MSKLFTLYLPAVPSGFVKMNSVHRPPFLENSASKEVAPGVMEYELTFTDSGVPDFQKVIESTILTALMLFVRAFPDELIPVLVYLTQTDPVWEKRIDMPSAQAAHVWMRETLNKAALLIGEDHSKCEEAGTCLHMKAGE